MTIPSNWYENFFHGLALDLWRKALPPEHTKAEADFLVQALQCGAGSHLLAVPCGNGRLSFELAFRGYQVTGANIAEEFIEEARALATPAAVTPGPHFILSDMRNMQRTSNYTGTYCF